MGNSVILIIITTRYMKILHKIASLFVWIGGVNWGLVGLSGFFSRDWNLVGLIFGKLPVVELAVYVLVGASAVFLVVTHRKDCKECESGASEDAPIA